MADVKTFVPAPDAPPSNAVGAFAWVRDNLFGSIGSAVATFLFFYLFLGYVPPFVEWALINANWTGTDRSVCEANTAGACWTFINVRFEQILFDYILRQIQMKSGGQRLSSSYFFPY